MDATHGCNPSQSRGVLAAWRTAASAAVAGLLAAGVAATLTVTLSTSERVTALEAQRSDVVRRLDRMEDKLDQLLLNR